jgi:hypothetical protein
MRLYKAKVTFVEQVSGPILPPKLIPLQVQER